MSRPKVNPVERALYAFFELNAQQRLEYETSKRVVEKLARGPVSAPRKRTKARAEEPAPGATEEP